MLIFLTLSIFKVPIGFFDVTIVCSFLTLLILLKIKGQLEISAKYLLIYYFSSILLLYSATITNEVAQLLSFVRFTLSYWSIYVLAYYFCKHPSRYDVIKMLS